MDGSEIFLGKILGCGRRSWNITKSAKGMKLKKTKIVAMIKRERKTQLEFQIMPKISLTPKWKKN